MSPIESIAAAIAAGPAHWLPPLPPQLPDAPPLAGIVPLDAIAADLFGADQVDFDDHEARRTFTTVLITLAMPATITSYLSAGQLAQDWRALDLAGPVRDRWQDAFPELTR